MSGCGPQGYCSTILNSYQSRGTNTSRNSRNRNSRRNRQTGRCQSCRSCRGDRWNSLNRSGDRGSRCCSWDCLDSCISLSSRCCHRDGLSSRGNRSLGLCQGSRRCGSISTFCRPSCYCSRCPAYYRKWFTIIPGSWRSRITTRSCSGIIAKEDIAAWR